jgi:hypothetical protein
MFVIKCSLSPYTFCSTKSQTPNFFKIPKDKCVSAISLPSEALGYLVPNYQLRQALYRRVQQAENITVMTDALVEDVASHESHFLYHQYLGISIYHRACKAQSRRSATNNNNLSFIVTTDGVLVFNAGGSYLVAKAISL